MLRPAYAPISHACLEAGAADAHDARPGGGQGCASSRLRFSLGIRGASIGSISSSWGEGGRGFALGAAMPLPATPVGALPAPGRSPLESRVYAWPIADSGLRARL